MNKKKYLNILSIFLLVLLFTLSGTCYANWTADEFETNLTQVYKQADRSYFLNQFFNSAAYLQNINDLNVGNYSSIFVRKQPTKIDLILFNNTTSFNIINGGWITTPTDVTISNVYAWTISGTTASPNFTYTGKVDGFTFRPNGQYLNVNNDKSSSEKFTVMFTNNSIYNQYNYTIYGLSMTANTPVYNGSTNVNNGQYYRLCRGFIGSYYYDNNNYENLEYVIIDNQTREFIGNKYVDYIPTTNGQVVDIYFYVSPDMNQIGYNVVTYYNEEVLYQDNNYNTLIVNRWRFFW